MDNFFNSLKGFSSPRYITLGIVGLALLVFFSLLSFRLTDPVMSTLYKNLGQEDSADVVTELGAMGVKFNVASGGSEILVESQDVLSVRMMLAEKGLPSKASIVGYEIFDKDSILGTSNFVMNVNLIRALEGELSRTISSLSSIKSARVHLVIPKRDVFERTRIEPSASVALKLKNRLKVPNEEALAVRHMVASSVPGLRPSQVTIVDSSGKILAKAESDEGGEFSTSAKQSEYKFQLEKKLKNTVNDLLEEAVGVGKVETQVAVDMTFEKVTISSEEYDPDSQVARSTQTNEQSSTMENKASGEVSVASELTGENQVGPGISERNQNLNEITNFEISKTVTNRVKDTGNLEKISVAVLVDGKYTTDENGEKIYTPRTEEELAQLRALVESAVGYDEKRGDKIEIVNMQFSRDIENLMPQEGPFDWIKQDLDSIIKTLVLGIIGILTIMLVIRPLVNKVFEVSSSDLEEEENKAQAQQQALATASQQFNDGQGESADISLDTIQTKIDNSPKQKVNDLIDNNPEETLSIIRSWLAQNR